MKIQSLSLHDALDRIAPGASRFADEDTIGGYHSTKALQQYPSGAIWGAEGQMLYALVRHFKPLNVLEVGTGRGVGTLHLAAAIKANNNGATLTTVDSGVTGYKPAQTPTARYVKSDAVAYLESLPDNSLDFIFEDLDHTAETIFRLASLAEDKLKIGGILVSHDAAHYNVGAEVQRGYFQAAMYVEVFLIPPCDCGLSFWQKLDEDEGTETVQPDYESMTIAQLKLILGDEAPARGKKQDYIDLLKG
jgi:predicted O-methyltransferase YrrM